MMQTRLPLARRARSATSTTITTSLLSQVILIVSGVFAARLLGVEDRGRLALLVLVPAALAQVGALGLPVAVTYYVARDPKSSPAIVQRVVPVAIAQAAVLVAVQAAILAVLVQSSHVGWTPALLSLLVVPASLVQQYGLAVHQGSQSFSTFNGLRVLPASLYAVGLTALEIAGGAGLIGVASVWVAGTSLAAILTAAATVRMLPARRPDGPSVGEMARFGRRAFIDATSPVEAFRIDQAVAGLLLSPAALGLYVVALAFTNLPRFIGQSIGMVAYPRIAGAKNQSGGQIWKYVALVAVVAGAAVVVMEAAMPRLVPLFFGAEFAAAVPLARIVLVAGFLVAIRRVLADGLRGTGRPALGTIGEIVSWVVLFPALAVFTPLWGVNGVAAALAVAAAGSLTVLGGLSLLAISRSAPALRNRLMPALAVIAVSVAAGVLLTRAGALASASPMLSAGAVMATTTLAIWINSSRTKDAFSVLNLVAAFYFCGFGAGTLYYWWAGDPAHPGAFNATDLAVAASFALLGWLSLVVGYAAHPFRSFGSRLATSFSLGANRVTPLRLAAILAVGWIARLALAATGRYFHTVPTGATTTSGSAAFLSTLSLLPTFVALLLATGAHVGRGSIARRTPSLVWLMFAGEFAWYLPTGARGDLAGLALALVIVGYYRRGRPSILAIACVAALFVFVVLPFGKAYRGDNRHYQLAPGAAFSRAVSETFRVSPGRALRNGADASFARFSDVTSLATVVHTGRSQIPRKPGETLSWSLTSWIPRAALPNKPDPGLFGNEFGRAYRLLDPSDRITSISVSQVGEMVLNFGLIGIAAGMALVGSVYRLIDEALVARRQNPTCLAVFAIVAWPLVMANETIVSLGLCGTLRLLAVFALALLLLRRVHAPRQVIDGAQTSFAASAELRP